MEQLVYLWKPTAATNNWTKKVYSEFITLAKIERLKSVKSKNNNNNNNVSYSKQACGDSLPRKPSMVANFAIIRNIKIKELL
jgi:hypothetical protein